MLTVIWSMHACMGGGCKLASESLSRGLCLVDTTTNPRGAHVEPTSPALVQPTSVPDYEPTVGDGHLLMGNMVVAGDLNLPSIKWSNLSSNSNPQYGKHINDEMINIVKDHSLHQTVTEHTRCENILKSHVDNLPKSTGRCEDHTWHE